MGVTVYAGSVGEAARLQATIQVQREVTAVAVDREVALQLVADRALEVFRLADGSVVELLDGTELWYAATAGVMTPHAGIRVGLGHSLSGLAVRRRVTLRCVDTESDPRVDQASCRLAGVGSMITAPLFAGKRVFGALKVSSRLVDAFSDSDLHQLELLAQSLGGVLRQADRFAEKSRLLEERTAALATVEAANQLKLDLIGRLGHEIRTPLTVILGHSELGLDDWAGLPDHRRAATLQAIHRQARRLDELVREVLTVVALDAGQLTAERQPVPLREAIAAALAAADIDVPVSCPEGLVVLAHPYHLQQILVNYLTNAGRYGGGATSVNAAAQHRRARICVADRGAGVPASFRDGTGRGLYIARALAHANGGEVGFEPNQPSGSAFTLELDLA